MYKGNSKTCQANIRCWHVGRSRRDDTEVKFQYASSLTCRLGEENKQISGEIKEMQSISHQTKILLTHALPSATVLTYNFKYFDTLKLYLQFLEDNYDNITNDLMQLSF